MAHGDLSVHSGVRLPEQPRHAPFPLTSKDSPLPRLGATDTISVSRVGAGQHEDMQTPNATQVDVSTIRNPEFNVSTRVKEAPQPELIESLRFSCDLDRMNADREQFKSVMSARAHGLVTEKFGVGGVTAHRQFKRCYNQAVREFLVSKDLCPREVEVLTNLQKAGGGVLSPEIDEKIENRQALIDALIARSFEESRETAVDQIAAINGIGPSAGVVNFFSMLDSRFNRESTVVAKNYRTLGSEIRVRLPCNSRAARDGERWWRPFPWQRTTRSIDEHGAQRIKSSASFAIPFVPINHVFNEELAKEMTRPLQGVQKTIREAAAELGPLITDEAENAARSLRYLSSVGNQGSDALEITASDEDSFELLRLSDEQARGQLLNEAFQAALGRSDFSTQAGMLNIASPVELVNFVEEVNNRSHFTEKERQMAGLMIRGLAGEVESSGSQHAREVNGLLRGLYSPQGTRSAMNELSAAVNNPDGRSDLHALARLPSYGRLDPADHRHTRGWIDAVRYLDKYLASFAAPAA